MDIRGIFGGGKPEHQYLKIVRAAICVRATIGIARQGEHGGTLRWFKRSRERAY
jgi:hypothetical protein